MSSNCTGVGTMLIKAWTTQIWEFCALPALCHVRCLVSKGPATA